MFQAWLMPQALKIKKCTRDQIQNDYFALLTIFCLFFVLPGFCKTSPHLVRHLSTHTTQKRQTFLPCQDFSLFCLMLQELVRIAFSVYHAKKYSKFSLLSGFLKHFSRLQFFVRNVLAQRCSVFNNKRNLKLGRPKIM